MRQKRGMGALLGASILGAVFLVGTLNSTLKTRATGLPSSTKPIVVLDAGHGGIDGGAQGSGILEKDVNLQITQKTRDFCELFGFTVIMTRDDDVSIHDEGKNSVRSQKISDLHNRLDIMTKTRGAVVVSIHLNKYPQSYVHGAQVFYAPKAEDSGVLAGMLQENLELFLEIDKKREIKKADSGLFLLYNNDINPAVLVECGFLSNPDEAQKLKDSEYQDKIAMTICYTLMKFNNRGDGMYGGDGQG